MIESTKDISSETYSMEAELKKIFMSREFLQIRVNEESKFSEMKISNFQSVVCENWHSMKYYVLTQYVSG